MKNLFAESKTNKGEPCALYCKPINENYYKLIKNFADNGTPCSTDNSVNKICLQGVCRVGLILIVCELFSSNVGFLKWSHVTCKK